MALPRHGSVCHCLTDAAISERKRKDLLASFKPFRSANPPLQIA